MEPTQRNRGGAAGATVSFLQDFSFARPQGTATPSQSPAPSTSAPSTSAPSTSAAPDRNRQQQSVPSSAGQDLGVVARTSIIVSKRQQGNPILNHIRNVKWVYGDIVPDYLLGASTCALFLSLRYHLLHPDYIFVRIRELQNSFRLRVLLCYVDLDDVIKPLHDITKTALLHDCTLLCAFSPEECARYLETLKSYENKPASNIQEKLDNDYTSRVTGALTSIRHVNRTDSLTLCQAFGSLGAVLGAPMEDLARCPGIGEKKLRRLFDTFHEPFRRRAPKALRLSQPSQGEHSDRNLENAKDGREGSLETTAPADMEAPTLLSSESVPVANGSNKVPGHGAPSQGVGGRRRLALRDTEGAGISPSLAEALGEK